MGSRIVTHVDLRGIETRLDTGINTAQQFLANQVRNDIEKFVPRRYGYLRNTSTIGLNGESIFYNMPYARKQFYTQFRNYTTPGTGPRWDLKGKSRHMRQWVSLTKAVF